MNIKVNGRHCNPTYHKMWDYNKPKTDKTMKALENTIWLSEDVKDIVKAIEDAIDGDLSLELDSKEECWDDEFGRWNEYTYIGQGSVKIFPFEIEYYVISKDESTWHRLYLETPVAQDKLARQEREALEDWMADKYEEIEDEFHNRSYDFMYD